MGQAIFEYKNISKQFFGVSALRDVSFSLNEGAVLGLIGENGAGKSTLMNIMGGVLNPDAGSMVLKGEDYEPLNPGDASKKGIEFIHQELNLFSNLSVAENIHIQKFPMNGKTPFISRKKMVEDSRQLLQQFDLHINPATLVEALSPGEKQMVEIIKALSGDGQIFLFDEPTTSLTSKETEKLFEIIRHLTGRNKSIVYISHILGDIKTICDDIVVLRDGMVMGTGPIPEYPVDKMISTMVGRDISQIFPDKTNVIQDEKMLEVRGLGQPGIVGGINFSLQKGEVLGVFGLMGSGRTEMAKMIFGVDKYAEGEIHVKGRPVPPSSPENCISRGLAFVTEDRRDEGLLMSVPIVENLGLVSLPDYCRNFLKLVDVKRLNSDAESISGSLRLKAANIRKQAARSLSGGNQQKVVIGKWLMKNPELLIMDEPTRGIDVGAKYEVYSIVNELAHNGTGILVISSEVEELMGICDRIIVMSRGEVIKTFTRNEFNQESIMRSAFRQEGHPEGGAVNE